MLIRVKDILLGTRSSRPKCADCLVGVSQLSMMKDRFKPGNFSAPGRFYSPPSVQKDRGIGVREAVRVAGRLGAQNDLAGGGAGPHRSGLVSQRSHPPIRAPLAAPALGHCAQHHPQRRRERLLREQPVLHHRDAVPPGPGARAHGGWVHQGGRGRAGDPPTRRLCDPTAPSPTPLPPPRAW